MSLMFLANSSRRIDQTLWFTSSSNYQSVAVSGDGKLIFYKLGDSLPVKVRVKSTNFQESSFSLSDGSIGRGYQISSDMDGSNLIVINRKTTGTPSLSFYSFNASTGFTNLLDLNAPAGYYIDNGLCSMNYAGTSALVQVINSTSGLPKTALYTKSAGTWTFYSILSVDSITSTISANSKSFVKRFDNTGIAVYNSNGLVGTLSNSTGNAEYGRGLSSTFDGNFVAIVDNNDSNSSVEVKDVTNTVVFHIDSANLPGGTSEKINAAVHLSMDGKFLTFTTESANPKLYLYVKSGSTYVFDSFITKSDNIATSNYLVQGENGGLPRKNLSGSYDGKVQAGIANEVLRIFTM
jgi:hypothetical protein